MKRGACKIALHLAILTGLLLLSLAGGPVAAAAQDGSRYTIPAGLSRLTPAEQWVLERVGAGGVADLRERFGEKEEARTIRGRFVEALLTDGFPGFKVHRSGIYLLNAIIPDPVSLAFGVVEHPVFLVGCHFRQLVDCGGSHFKKNLALMKSVFEQRTNFYRLKVELDAFFGE